MISVSGLRERRRDEISCLKRDSIVGGPDWMGIVPFWILGWDSSRNGPIYLLTTTNFQRASKEEQQEKRGGYN